MRDMKEERRVTREDAQALAQQMQDATKTGQNRVEFKVLDAELVMERVGDGGFEISAPGESSGSRYYLASAFRPQGFPPGVPFIPNEPVMVSAPGPGATMLVWWAPGDALSVFAQLDEQCVADRWSVKESVDAPAAVREYENDGVTRRLFVSSGIVTFIEMKTR